MWCATVSEQIFRNRNELPTDFNNELIRAMVSTDISGHSTNFKLGFNLKNLTSNEP